MQARSRCASKVPRGRRDSDEQGNRYIARKFPKLDQSRLKTVRNKKGQSLVGVVKEELKKKKLSQGRLSVQFSTRLYNEFDLYSTVFDDLPNVHEAPIVPELAQALDEFHVENPIDRSMKPMKNFLSRCEGLDDWNFNAVLKGCEAGPTLEPGTAVVLKVAILDYLGRMGLPIRHPAFWEKSATLWTRL